MRTKGELLKAVILPLDNDNKSTPLTTQLYQIINLRECCFDTSDYECRLREMYSENELCYNKYNKQRKELKDNQLKDPIPKIDYDTAMSHYNRHLTISRMRRKVLGFALGDVTIEMLIGRKKYYEREFYNNI